MLSGAGNAPYAYTIKDPLSQARAVAEAIDIENIQELDNEQLAEKLRSSDPVSLINACDKLKIWSVDPLTISRPVVEDCSLNDGFLCANPTHLWRNGDYTKIPLLTGFMDGDGGVRALAILENKTQFYEINKRFDELIPKLMEIDDDTAEKTAGYLKAIKRRYFNGSSAVPNDTSIIRLYTER